MYPNADILEFLFATTATIVATVTGLIGAFSTFRLQNINAELSLLKGLIINKKFGDNICVNDFIKGKNYHLLERIYNSNIESVNELEKIIIGNNLENYSDELLLDLDNIRRNQLLHDHTKSLTITGFKNALFFVFISLLLLIFSNGLLETGEGLWLILFLYLTGAALIFKQFVKQIKQLML